MFAGSYYAEDSQEGAPCRQGTPQLVGRAGRHPSLGQRHSGKWQAPLTLKRNIFGNIFEENN